MLTNILKPQSLILAAAMAVLLDAGTSNAAPTTPTPTPNHPATAKKVPHGITNYARNFNGWTGYCYLPQYHCYGFHCGKTRTWFYWCDTYARFLPISYIAQYPPGGGGVIPTNPWGTAPPLPPGATPIPDSTNGPPQNFAKKKNKNNDISPAPDE